MADVAAESNDSPVKKVVEKPVVEEEKSTEAAAVEDAEVVENGDSKAKDIVEVAEKVQEVEDEEKTVENGTSVENGLSSNEEEKEVKEDEVCGIKRKSEVGLETGDSVESTEKKQKVEESDEPEVAAANGVC